MHSFSLTSAQPMRAVESLNLIFGHFSCRSVRFHERVTQARWFGVPLIFADSGLA